jgi:2-polyprenyl-3-methyl-5-hydroxy-6-metoxy-1,4-benzoquinol methylase
MALARVAIIFDNQARPETTGLYCRRTLGHLCHVEHFLPTELARLPRAGFDWYLHIDDGLGYRLPTDLRPRAFWAIDTHVDFDACLAGAADCDIVFAAQRDGAARLRSAGIASTSWLPLACDPEIHRRYEVATSIDVCFVGNVFPGPRAELLALLQRRFPNTFVGRRFFEEMALTYSASKVVFNRSVGADINMRVFEALACGALLVTNDLTENGQGELVQDGVHLATYRDPQELLDKVAWYLTHDSIRERIAAAGRAEVLAKHTYRHRMEELLRRCENGTRTAVAVAQPVPASQRLMNKDASYYEHARPELAALVPADARHVLDVGCGAGALGALLKARQPVEVIGIERSQDAARIARSRIDDVVIGDVESLDVDFAAASFDCIICGDILEHLRDPLTVLRRARHWLKPNGRLVASLPNVRHHSVVQALLAGNWTYESAGLLDADHLRFFTRREIEKLFFRAGFRVRELGIVPGDGYDQWYEHGRPCEVRLGALCISGMPSQDAEEFFVYQYLVVAEPDQLKDFGLTSIVIVTHNELGYTRQCHATMP